MNRLLSIIRFSLGYLSYGLSHIIFVLLFGPVFLALSPWPHCRQGLAEKCIFIFFRLFSHSYLPALGIYRIAEIQGLEHTHSRPALFVANHRSFMDSLLILGLLPRASVLIKSRYTCQPAIGMMARFFNLVSVDGERFSSVKRSAEKCRLLFAGGQNLLVFPEGTRARSGRLQPFKNLAFRLAIEARIPIIPVLVHSTLPFMAKVPGSFFPRGHNHYHIRFLSPESPAADDDVDTLCNRVFRRMACELQQMDRGTFWQTNNLDK